MTSCTQQRQKRTSTKTTDALQFVLLQNIRHKLFIKSQKIRLKTLISYRLLSFVSISFHFSHTRFSSALRIRRRVLSQRRRRKRNREKDEERDRQRDKGKFSVTPCSSRLIARDAKWISHRTRCRGCLSVCSWLAGESATEAPSPSLGWNNGYQVNFLLRHFVNSWRRVSPEHPLRFPLYPPSLSAASCVYAVGVLCRVETHRMDHGSLDLARRRRGGGPRWIDGKKDESMEKILFRALNYESLESYILRLSTL